MFVEKMCSLALPNEIGQRLQYARQLTGMSRVTFCKNFGLSPSSMVKWELGYSPLTSKTAKVIIECLMKSGVKADFNWLMTGKGTAAEKIELHSFTEEPFGNEAQLIEKELLWFQAFHKAILNYRVFDDSCLPLYYPGDYVAGPTLKGESLLTLKGEICILKLEDHALCIRKVAGYNSHNLTFHLETINQNTKLVMPSIQNVKVIEAARITLFRRPQ